MLQLHVDGRAVFACALLLLLISAFFQSVESRAASSARELGSAQGAPSEPTPAPPAGAAADGGGASAGQGAAGEPAAAEDAPAGPATSPPATQAPARLLADSQAVIYYGTPLASGLGVLGTAPLEEAALAVKAHASRIDALNGERGAFGTMDIIYSIAQAEPTENGRYIRYTDDWVIEQYLAAAERHDLQLMLDLQIGRGDILEEVRMVERFLVHPRVHVAVDPEYAVGPDGIPGTIAGKMSGGQINQVQEYLAGLVREHNLPSKLFVVHQFLASTVTEPEHVGHYDGVEFVLNMDAFGDRVEKERKYRMFSAEPHSKHDGYNVFLQHDYEVLSDEEILRLDPVPSVIFFQ
jgi:hypothetical protein